MSAAPFEGFLAHGGGEAVRVACRFFTGKDPVHQTLGRISDVLKILRIPHAFIGGLALNAHGYRRTTDDVDLIVTSEGLEVLESHVEGLELAPATRRARLRDIQTGVKIDFYLSGTLASPCEANVHFPDPSESYVLLENRHYVLLPTLVELKPCAGVDPGRLKHRGDVQELIRELTLPADFAEQLNPNLRAKYAELWAGVHQRSGQEPDQHYVGTVRS